MAGGPGDMTCDDVVKLVEEKLKEYVKKSGNRDFDINVDANFARQEDDWWYIPVRHNKDLPQTYAYYDILADVEFDLQETDNLNILLVPTALDDKGNGQ